MWIHLIISDIGLWFNVGSMRFEIVPSRQFFHACRNISMWTCHVKEEKLHSHNYFFSSFLKKMKKKKRRKRRKYTLLYSYSHSLECNPYSFHYEKKYFFLLFTIFKINIPKLMTSYFIENCPNIPYYWATYPLHFINNKSSLNFNGNLNFKNF